MIYTELTKKALTLAYRAHHGQLDQSNIPYIFHPYHLAEQMDDEISVCVALLHDVAEDTSISLEELQKNFPKEVIEALRLLTHEAGTDYFSYIQKIKEHPVARKVKLADLAHNCDESRLIGCTAEAKQKAEERCKKYAKAKAMLK